MGLDLSNITREAFTQIRNLDELRPHEFILDISTLPFLRDILKAKPKTVWLPDTLEKLLALAKEKEEYHETLVRLFKQWTRRKIDIDMLSKIIFEKKFEEVEIKLITIEDVDKRVYGRFLEKLVRKGLRIEFSKLLNLLGDIVGKIIGGAKKLKCAILLANRALLRLAKKLIPILDAANVLVNAKTDFLERNLHLPLRRTRGVRWLIGITVGVVISPVGIVLGVLDP